MRTYCPDPQHLRGRHKARLFRATLGIGREDAEWLRAVLLEGVHTDEAIDLGEDEFGRRWRIDIGVARHEKSVVVRTVWIVLTDEDFARFLTCWVL